MHHFIMSNQMCLWHDSCGWQTLQEWWRGGVFFPMFRNIYSWIGDRWYVIMVLTLASIFVHPLPIWRKWWFPCGWSRQETRQRIAEPTCWKRSIRISRRAFVTGHHENCWGKSNRRWSKKLGAKQENMDISRVYFCCCSSKFLFLDLILWDIQRSISQSNHVPS